MDESHITNESDKSVEITVDPNSVVQRVNALFESSLSMGIVEEDGSEKALINGYPVARRLGKDGAESSYTLLGSLSEFEGREFSLTVNIKKEGSETREVGYKLVIGSLVWEAPASVSNLEGLKLKGSKYQISAVESNLLGL